MENELKIQLEKLNSYIYDLEEENKELKEKVNVLEDIVNELFERLHKFKKIEEKYNYDYKEGLAS